MVLAVGPKENGYILLKCLALEIPHDPNSVSHVPKIDSIDGGVRVPEAL
jgi:hypothetical protein